MYLPKPLYVAKPYIYAITGFSIATLPIDPIYKLAGLMLGTAGLGFILNRMKYPIKDKS